MRYFSTALGDAAKSTESTRDDSLYDEFEIPSEQESTYGIPIAPGPPRMPVPEEPMPPAVPDVPNFRSASEFAPIPPAPSEPSSGKGTGTVLSEFRYLLRNTPPLIVAIMILSVVGMNLMANKSIDTGLDWLALDCGILFSWMCFLSMDVLTRCFGPRATTLLSIVALVANWVMALLFFIASIIPGVWSESYVEGSEAVINAALDGTFSGTWFIILGSSIAFVVSALINNYLNAAIGKRLERSTRDTGFGAFALRSYVSTFVAQVADNLVFALLVSQVFFGWTLLQCVMCALTGALLELLFEIVFSPLGYKLTTSILSERASEEAKASYESARRAHRVFVAPKPPAVPIARTSLAKKAAQMSIDDITSSKND